MTKRGKGGDYGVGYRRPPKHTQFKKGQSGNPRGRQKGSKNPKAIIQELLNQKVELRMGGKSRQVPLLEAIMRGSAHCALKGDVKNIAYWLKLANDSSEALAGEMTVVSELEDLELLSGFRNQILKDGGNNDDT